MFCINKITEFSLSSVDITREMYTANIKVKYYVPLVLFMRHLADC